MYVTVTEEHLRKAVKAGRMDYSMSNPIGRAIREAGIKGVKMGLYEVFNANHEMIDFEGKALAFSILTASYRRFHTPSILKALRYLLPLKIRVPNPESGKK